MENISEISKKKTKRSRRSLTKTRRNLKKKSQNQVVSTPDVENTSKDEVEEENDIFKSWFFSWF